MSQITFFHFFNAWYIQFLVEKNTEYKKKQKDSWKIGENWSWNDKNWFFGKFSAYYWP